MNQAVLKQQETETKTPTLTALTNQKPIPQGLKDIKAMLGDERHTPEYVYSKVLTEQERTIVCFTAGLKKSDVDKAFSRLTFDERDKIRKAILQLSEIVKAFTSANAMAPAKFYKGAKREVASGAFEPANQLQPHQH